MREDDFLRAARIAAYVCVEEALAPRAVASERLRGSFVALETKLRDTAGEEVPGPKVVDGLVQCGLLEELVELAETRVRFTSDPIAEYLMAMHIAGGGRSETVEIEKRIAEQPKKARGLAEAVEHVRAASEA